MAQILNFSREKETKKKKKSARVLREKCEQMIDREAFTRMRPGSSSEWKSACAPDASSLALVVHRAAKN